MRSIIIIISLLIFNNIFISSCKQDCSCDCIINGQPKNYDLGNISSSFAQDKCDQLHKQLNADTCYLFIAK